MAHLQQYTKIICIVAIKDHIILTEESAVEMYQDRLGRSSIKITSTIPDSVLELDPNIGDKAVVHLVFANQVKRYQTIVHSTFLSHSVNENAKQIVEFGIKKEEKVAPEVLVIGKALVMSKR